MAFFRQFPKTNYDFQQNGVITKIVDIFRYVKVDSVFLDDMSTYQYFQVRAGERPDVVSSILYGTPDYYWTFFVINDHLKTGLSGWPMSPAEFEDYMRLEFSGTVIDTSPTTSNNNSLAGKFTVGEVIRGSTSMAFATLKERNIPMSQLILNPGSGNFRTDGQEVITGDDSNSSVISANAYLHRDAPHHYVDLAGLETYSSRLINESDTAAGIQEGVQEINLSPVSYYEYELELNDERGSLRVVRPNMIYQFAQRYSALINE